MLRFFRQLRQSLLAENRAGKYLLYAVGEIVLVVIGILIALQVNNWNEERTNRNRLNNYLLALQNALEEDISNLKTVEWVNLFRSRSINYLLNSWGGTHNLPEKDSTMMPSAILKILPSHYVDQDPGNDPSEVSIQAFVWSTRPRFIKINREALEELKNTGMYSMIQDTALKKAISRYYSRADWFFDPLKESSYQAETQGWNKHIIENHEILIDDVGIVKDPSEVLKDDKTRLRLREIASGAEYRVEMAREMMERAQKLTEIIHNHLAALKHE